MKALEQCDCCKFPAKTKKYQKDSSRDNPSPGFMNICDLCAHTSAGNTVEYPRDNQDVLRTICYVGNAILAEIRKQKR